MSLYTNVYVPELLKLKQRQYRRFVIAAVLLVALILPTLVYMITPDTYAVTGIEWTSNSDFNQGTTSNTVVNDGEVALDFNAEMDNFVIDGLAFGNNIQDSDARTNVNADGEIESGGKSYVYDTASTPALVSNNVGHSFLTESGLLYVSTNIGLQVIDTKNTVDISDDTLVIRYYTGSTPALAHDNSLHSFLTENGILYISTYGGLSVINTQNTIDPGDDTLVTRYHPGSSPVLADNNVLHSFLTDSGLLYVATYFGGLSVINTQNTIDPGDDTLVTRYHTGSSPGLAIDNVVHSFLTDNGLLYAVTSNGLSVINTQNTIDPGDDTLVTRYHTGSSPSLINNDVLQSFLTDAGLLYVATFNGGLSVINTQNTIDPGDDTLVTRYHTGSSPALANTRAYYSLLTDVGLLYVGTYYGIQVINTQNTIDPADDTLVRHYHSGSSPTLPVYVRHFFVADTGVVYVASNDHGLSILSPDEYNENSSYLSTSRLITDIPTSTISYSAEITEDHDVTLQYRTGSSTAVWRDDFDTTGSFEGDLYDWGSEFQDVSIVNGVLTLSNPSETWGAYSWFDTGFGEDYFDAGSILTIRLRVNFNNSNKLFYHSLFFDEWEGDYVENLMSNQWVILTLEADTPFNTIGLSTDMFSGFQWEATDSLEIDWIQITTPDSQGLWNAWSDPCIDTTCPIDPDDLADATWLQYRLNLSTTDTSTTPVVTSVSYSNGYKTNGSYISDNVAISDTQQPVSFITSESVPSGTALSYEYSTDQGDTWLPMSNSYTFSKYLTPTNFMWKANFTTSNTAVTPTIDAASLMLNNISSGQSGTSITKRISNLEAEGKFEEANSLRRSYPQFFNNPNGEAKQLEQIIAGLKQLVLKLEELKLIREAEEGN